MVRIKRLMISRKAGGIDAIILDVIWQIMSGFLLVVVGEGVFGWGVMIPWLWYVQRENQNDRLCLIAIVVLGIIGSSVSGSIVGGLSLWWSVCLLVFWVAGHLLSSQKWWMVVVLTVALVLVGDKILGLSSSLLEVVIVGFVSAFLFRMKQVGGGISLRRYA